MKTFSVRTLMGLMVIPAIGLGALKYANRWSAGLMLMTAMAAVGIAMVGAVIMRGRERAWWAAFAFFGGGYLVLTFAPGFSTALMPRLGTTTVLDFVHSEFVASSTETTLPQILWWQHVRVLAQVDGLMAENRGPDDEKLAAAMRMLNNLETRITIGSQRFSAPRVQE